MYLLMCELPEKIGFIQVISVKILYFSEIKWTCFHNNNVVYSLADFSIIYPILLNFVRFGWVYISLNARHLNKLSGNISISIMFFVSKDL